MGVPTDVAKSLRPVVVGKLTVQWPWTTTASVIVIYGSRKEQKYVFTVTIFPVIRPWTWNFPAAPKKPQISGYLKQINKVGTLVWYLVYFTVKPLMACIVYFWIEDNATETRT